MSRRAKGEGSVFQCEGGGPSPLLNLKPWEADPLTSSLDFSPGRISRGCGTSWEGDCRINPGEKGPRPP